MFMEPISVQSAIGIAGSIIMMGCQHAFFIVEDAPLGWVAITYEELAEMRADGYCGEPAAVVMPGERCEPLILT
jgi:hypothetical protein